MAGAEKPLRNGDAVRVPTPIAVASQIALEMDKRPGGIEHRWDQLLEDCERMRQCYIDLGRDGELELIDWVISSMKLANRLEGRGPS